MTPTAPKKTVVILISDKRSGSTLFQRELFKHTEINTLKYSPHTFLESHHWLKAAVMLSQDGQGFQGNKVYSGYGTKANARKYMEDCIKGNIHEFIIPSSDEELIFKGWDVLCEKYAQPVFFEKSPQIIAHTAALDLLFEWYQNTEFDVKFIFLVRNPMAIMYSAYQLFYTDPRKRQWGWADLMQNMFEFYERVSASDKIWVRYEDMVDNPSLFFEKVQNFIGLPINEEMGNGAHRESKKKWVNDSNYDFHFDPKIISVINKLGYGGEDIFNPEGKKPSLMHKSKMVFNRSLRLPIYRLIDRRIKPLLLKRAK
jgi:hypothetical protein